jgi:uncharacterized coiled-coil DUF342 family protein
MPSWGSPRTGRATASGSRTEHQILRALERKGGTPHLRLRIEPQLLGRLEKAREKAGRTLTGEIVHRLELTFRRDDLIEHTRQVGRDAAIAALTGVEGLRTELDALKELRDTAIAGVEGLRTELDALKELAADLRNALLDERLQDNVKRRQDEDVKKDPPQ